MSFLSATYAEDFTYLKNELVEAGLIKELAQIVVDYSLLWFWPFSICPEEFKICKNDGIISDKPYTMSIEAIYSPTEFRNKGVQYNMHVLYSTTINNVRMIDNRVLDSVYRFMHYMSFSTLISQYTTIPCLVSHGKMKKQRSNQKNSKKIRDKSGVWVKPPKNQWGALLLNYCETHHLSTNEHGLIPLYGKDAIVYGIKQSRKLYLEDTRLPGMSWPFLSSLITCDQVICTF